MRKPQHWKIHHRGVLVGTACMKGQDMGVVFGDFEEGPGYEPLRSLFRSFVAAGNDKIRVEAYYWDRDALDLVITDEHGERVEGAVHILDFQEEMPEEPLAIEVYPVS